MKCPPLIRCFAKRLKRRHGARFSPTLLSGNPVRINGFIVEERPLLNGRATSIPKPGYPPAARAVRAGGTVTVRLTVDEEGKVTYAEAVSGHPLLRVGAVAAARKAKFLLAVDGRSPVATKGVLVYNFIPPDPPKE